LVTILLVFRKGSDEKQRFVGRSDRKSKKRCADASHSQSTSCKIHQKRCSLQSAPNGSVGGTRRPQRVGYAAWPPYICAFDDSSAIVLRQRADPSQQSLRIPEIWYAPCSLAERGTSVVLMARPTGGHPPSRSYGVTSRPASGGLQPITSHPP
jgi:hypothetical protein